MGWGVQREKEGARGRRKEVGRFEIAKKRTGREDCGLLLFLTCGCHVILVLLRFNTPDNCVKTCGGHFVLTC